MVMRNESSSCRGEAVLPNRACWEGLGGDTGLVCPYGLVYNATPKGTNPTPQQGKGGHFLLDTALTGMVLEGLQPPQCTSKAQLY